MGRRDAMPCLAICAVLLLAACAPPAATSGPVAEPTTPPLPDSAYRMQPGPASWVDPATGREASRTWSLEGERWPIALVMNTAQSPQLLLGWADDIYRKQLQSVGVTPVIERTRADRASVFLSLRRSRWPFVYLPLSDFMEYSRTGGMQYVLVAGSAAAPRYLVTAASGRIDRLPDLKGKRVAVAFGDPVAGALLTGSVERSGLSIGEGPDAVAVSLPETAPAPADYDAVVEAVESSAGLRGRGLHAISDLSESGYTQNDTVLVVERSVLEGRPEVLAALLQAHWQSQRAVERQWDARGLALLVASWNGSEAAFGIPVRPEQYSDQLAGAVPEVRLDRRLIAGAFAFLEERDLWGWPGSVETSRLVDYDAFNAVLKSNGAGVRQ